MSTAIAEQDLLAEVGQQVDARVAAARMLVVQTPQQAEQAVEMLGQIAAAKRAGKDAHTFLVKPLKDQAKAIEARLKETTEPLEEADRLVREKVLAFKQEEERRVAEEQARIDAERREREEAAEAERQRQATEAAEAERIAREHEQARQAELRAAENERAREIAMLDDQELRDVLETGNPADIVLARAELTSREEAQVAQERADAARQAAEEATQASIAAASAPAVSVTATKLAASSGTANVRREWKATAINRSELPDDYLVLVVDEARINREVKSGVREIPGVTIEQVAGLSVRAR